MIRFQKIKTENKNIIYMKQLSCNSVHSNREYYIVLAAIRIVNSFKKEIKEYQLICYNACVA